jgi:hypothetical protein
MDIGKRVEGQFTQLLQALIPQVAAAIADGTRLH